jgi:dTDP-4-amino-4,6-dideoxygalactose transaminase
MTSRHALMSKPSDLDHATTWRPSGRIPMLRPLLPTFEQLEPWLRQIDRNRFYTNAGPLETELRDKLARHFEVPSPKHVSMVSNATLGLIILLKLIAEDRGLERGKCLMPSWSFSATGQAAIWAGMEPHFVDIRRETGMLDPTACQAEVDRLGAEAISAVVVVSYLGSPVPPREWEAFRARTGIPVIIDGAAGFDGIRCSGLPTVISLHATKSFSTGEGGCILAEDQGMIAQLDRMKAFGFDAERDVVVEGMNAKLSEYNAAVGLAFLEAWPGYREQVRTRICHYNDRLQALDNQVRPMRGMGESWVASMYAVDLPTGSSAHAREKLSEAQVDARVWWEFGMHAKTLFKAFDHGPLPATEEIATSSLGLPFYPDISVDEIDYVADALGAALASAPHA